MKTSHKEGVSDRPPTPPTSPNVRHHSSTATVDVSSAHLDAIQAGSHTRPAPIPLPTEAARGVLAIVVDVDTRVTPAS